MSLSQKVSRRTVIPLRILVGLLFILVAFSLDNVVQDTVHPIPAVHNAKSTGVSWDTQLAKDLSKYGDWPYLLLYGVIILAILCLLRRYDASRILALILVAAMVTGFTCTIIRSTTGRTRPLSHHPQGFYGPRLDSQWIIGKYEFGAFPSGHTATAMGLAAAIWLFNRRLAVLFGVLAAGIAWSRIALGCHHFSDVVAATVWAFLVAPPLVFLLDPWLSRLWGKWFRHWDKSQAGASTVPSTMISPEKMSVS